MENMNLVEQFYQYIFNEGNGACNDLVYSSYATVFHCLC